MSLTKNEKISANQVELEITVGAEEFNAALSKAAAREGKKFTVPGFRKGKAPRGVIEKMYGEGVFYTDAINDLFPDVYSAAVEEAGIEPVDQPDVEITDASKENGFVLKVNVTVKPEVTLGKYKGLKAEKPANTVGEEQVEAELSRMAERTSRMVSKEGAAEMGDTANINFEGFTDGVAFEGGKGENFDLILGSGQFIPGFEEQVVGHAAGEDFDVNVTFPEEYQAAELAGKPAVFKCHLNECKVKEMPTLDDDFAKDVSEYDTLDELKESIRKELTDRAEKSAEAEIENALIDQVIDSMEAEIPECMISQRVDEMVREFSYRMESQGLKLETYLQYTGNTMESYREQFTEQATKQVKVRLALEKIAQLENIEASEEDLDAEIKRIAEMYKIDEAQVRMMVPVEEIKKDLVSNKALDLVRSSATVSTKKEKKTTRKSKKAAETTEAPAEAVEAAETASEE